MNNAVRQFEALQNSPAAAFFKEVGEKLLDNLKKLSLVLIMCCVAFSQEPCEGACYTEEEEQNIELHITNLENQIKYSNDQIITMKSLMMDFEKNDSLNISMINDYKKQLEYKDEMIKLVKPKWYHNRYLWFFGGIILTSTSVRMARNLD